MADTKKTELLPEDLERLEKIKDFYDDISDKTHNLAEKKRKEFEKEKKLSEDIDDITNKIAHKKKIIAETEYKISRTLSAQQHIQSNIQKNETKLSDSQYRSNLIKDQIKQQNILLSQKEAAYRTEIASGKVTERTKYARLREIGAIKEVVKAKEIAANKEADLQKELNKKIAGGLIASSQKNILLEQLKHANSLSKKELEQLLAQEKLLKIKFGILKTNKEIEQGILRESEHYGKIKKFLQDMAGSALTRWLAVLTASLERWKELDKAAGDFREKTGFLVTQTYRIEEAARAVNNEMSHLGVGIDESYASAHALTEQFHVIGLVTKDMMADTAQMAANLGISVVNAAKFRGLFTSIANTSGMTVTGMMQAASALAEMGGVAPSEVIKDIAEASAETLSFLSKSPLALIKATVEARRLGTTVNALSKSARGFLNYQDSITSELEASALIGKSLNFQEARAAAYAGDVVKSRELALKQIEKVGDFTKLNVYQQEALAKAAGMTTDEVIKQQNQQKMLAAMRASASGRDLDLLKKYEEMQKKIAEDEKAAKDDLVARGIDMVEQQLRQSEMNKLTNAFKSIWTDISDALLPIANTIMPVIVGAFRTLAGIVKIIGALLRFVFDPFSKIISNLTKTEEKASRLEGFFQKMGDVVAYLSKQLEVWNKTVEENTWLKWIIGLTVGIGTAVVSFIILKKALIGVRSAFSLTTDAAKRLTTSLSPIRGGAGGGPNIGRYISNLVGGINWRDLAKIAAMMIVLAGGLYVLGKALTIFNDVKWESLAKAGVALSGLLVIGAIAGKMPEIALGMLAVGASAALLGVGLLAAGKGFKFFGKGVSIILTAVKSVLQIMPQFVNGLVKPIKNLADIGFLRLSGVALGLTAIGAALSTFALSSAFAAIVNFFGGDGIIKNIIAMGNAADGLSKLSDELYNIFEKYKSIATKMSEKIKISIESNGMEKLSNDIDIIFEKFKSINIQTSEKIVSGIDKISNELDNVLSKYKSIAAQMSEKIKISVESNADILIEVRYLDELKETVDRLVTAINSLGGTGGTATPIVNVNSSNKEMTTKIDELITLLKDGAIGVNIDGVKASKLLAKASS